MLSAQHMPKNSSHSWGVTVLAKDDSGAVMYHPSGQPQKTKVPIEPGHYANGEPQLLYFPDGHEKEDLRPNPSCKLNARDSIVCLVKPDAAVADSFTTNLTSSKLNLSFR